MSDIAGFEPFNRDVAGNGGYLYTTRASASSILANRRLTDVALEVVRMGGQRVVDIGCGDGAYTVELFDRGKAAFISGFDPAEKAVSAAVGKIQGRNIFFGVHAADHLPVADDSFDIAHIRGVLHHMDKPIDALREALRIAPLLVIIEPNGYNPVLKILEKYSRYHLEHGEKSYPPHMLDQWVRQLGGTVAMRKWAGFVPFFCPNWLAVLLKWIEPVIEAIPVVRAICCAVYVQVVSRPAAKARTGP